MGGGIQHKLDQTIQNGLFLKEISESVSSKAEQSVTVQQKVMELTGSTEGKTDQLIQSQLQLKEISDGISSKADQVLTGQTELRERGAADRAKLDQIALGLQQGTNEIEFSRRSRLLFSDFHYWEENFYKAIKGVDIEERYDSLIGGLSEKDVKLVESIIGRIQHFFEHGDTNCYLPHESEIIYCNRKEYLNVVQLNDHCFAYKKYKLPLNIFEIGTFICNYGLDLIDHPEYVDGKDIIDAGAYIGDSALVFDRFFAKCRRIYAFEPDVKSYALMEKTIAMNKLANIVPVALALGDSNSEGELISDGMGANLLERQFGKEEKNKRTIKIVRLDDYVKQNHIVPGVIKTDLEGFEMHFLRGALDTIKKYRPIMVLSIYHSADDFFGIKPFIESLNLGYKFKLFKADDGMILGGTCLICIPEK